MITNEWTIPSSNKIFAIDPGSTESAFVKIDKTDIVFFNKVENEKLISIIRDGMISGALWDYYFVIEQVRSYGMPVGAEIFDTVHWSGRFDEAAHGNAFLMPRKDVKMNLCGNTKAKDANIIQALRDRFAYGVRNYGKGTQKEPGYFHGFAADVWQAYALGVTYWDKNISKLES